MDDDGQLAAVVDGRSLDRKTAIVALATQLFVENGGELPAMGAIAARAGVTRPALYYYYPSKADLVRAVMRQLDWDWWTDIIPASRGETSLWRRIRLLLLEFAEQSFSTEPGMYLALLRASQGNSEVRSALLAQAADMREAIAGMVMEHADEIDLREQSIDEVVDGIIGLIWCISSGVLNTSSKVVLAQVRQTIDLVCAGR